MAAKRYLCATDPGYFDTLSAASVHSLTLQGGPMNAEEAAQFETQPSFHEIIAVRYLDDAGKRVGMVTPEFAHFAPMLQRMVNARSRDGAAEQDRINSCRSRITPNQRAVLRNRVVLRSHKIVDNPLLS